jgi:hypothetical protein
MDLRAKNEPRNNLLEVEELSDLQLESIAGGNKEERKAKRRRKKVFEWLKRFEDIKPYDIRPPYWPIPLPGTTIRRR